MPHTTKIATCCYCGTRAALVLAGQVRHELACSGCGAPLHELKALRPADDRRGPRKLVRPAPLRRTPDPGPARPVDADRRKKKKKSKRKSVLRDLLEDAVEAIEDIFD